MNSNNSRHKNQIYYNNIMSTRIHLPIYNRRTNRNLPIKFITRYHTSRYILRSCTLPLRPKNRSSFRYICRNQPLIPTNNRNDTPSTMSKSPILHNIHWSKFNILPSTFPRTKRNTTSILRLPRHIYKMKCSFFVWGNSIICCTSNIYFHYLRSACCSTTSNCNISYTIINRMR